MENNFLSVNDLDRFAQQARNCEGDSCQKVIKDMVDTNVRQQQEMMDFCNSNPNQCAQKYGYLVDQWPVFEHTLKNMDRDGTLPVEFRNYLSAVNTLGQAATGKVGELGWTKRFEAMGMSPETAQAMAMTLPIVVEGTRGAKSSPSPSKVTANSQGTNWKAGEGQYSQKNQGTVTNVEHPTGKFDGKSLPNEKGSIASEKTIKNDVLDNPRVGTGEKGTGSGNKVDQLPNKTVIDIDGKEISVYTNRNKPTATQEFPSVAKAHGFNDIVDNYAGLATQTKLKNGATLYQLPGSLNGVEGRFEWIVDPKLGGVSHRMFVTGGTVNGVPSKP